MALTTTESFKPSKSAAATEGAARAAATLDDDGAPTTGKAGRKAKTVRPGDAAAAGGGYDPSQEVEWS